MFWLRKAPNQGLHQSLASNLIESSSKDEFQIACAIQNQLFYLTNWYLNAEEKKINPCKIQEINLLFGLISKPNLAEIPDFKEAPNFISKAYQKLWPLFKKSSLARLTIEIPSFKLSDYNSFTFRNGLAKLNKSASRKLSFFLKNFIIHGSLATLDFAPGFSDLDAFLIIKKEVFLQPARLKQLRGRLRELKIFLKDIDENSHHGFLCCHETNLDYYCNSYLPIPTLRHGKNIVGNNRIVFHLRDSSFEERQNFFHYAKIFYGAYSTGVLKSHPYRGVFLEANFKKADDNLYQLKYFISMMLLMPSLYLQAKGIYVYKKFSFNLFNNPFLKKLSKARDNFKRFLNKQNAIPENLQKLIGRDYFKEAALMLNKMSEDLLSETKQRKFINFPIRLPKQIYEKARLELINHFKKNSDVLAIYEYGSVSAPGISDLDIIVVARENLKQSSSDDFIISKERFRFASKVLTGTLMIMGVQEFENIQWFDNVFLKKIYGQSIIANKLSKTAEKYRETASIIDWLPERTLRLVQLWLKSELDVSSSLRLLRSFTHSLQRVHKFIKDPYYQEFIQEVSNLRKNWKGQTSELLQLIKKGIYVGYEAMSDFTDKYIKEDGFEGTLDLFPGQRIIFTKQISKIDPEFAIAFSKEGSVSIPVSAKLTPHFFCYSRQKEFLAKQMRKQFKSKNPVMPKDKNYRAFLKKKISLATKCGEFLIRNNLKSGLFRFGFYFKYHS